MGGGEQALVGQSYLASSSMVTLPVPYNNIKFYIGSPYCGLSGTLPCVYFTNAIIGHVPLFTLLFVSSVRNGRRVAVAVGVRSPIHNPIHSPIHKERQAKYK